MDLNAILDRMGQMSMGKGVMPRKMPDVPRPPMMPPTRMPPVGNPTVGEPPVRMPPILPPMGGGGMPVGVDTSPMAEAPMPYQPPAMGLPEDHSILKQMAQMYGGGYSA